MSPVRTLSVAGPELQRSVAALVEVAIAADDSPALSDHLVLDLAQGGGEGFAGFAIDDTDGELMAYGQISITNEGASFEAVVHPAHRGREADLLRALVGAAHDTIVHRGGGTIGWWVTDPTDLHLALAMRFAMAEDRRLFQMRRTLPADQQASVVTRDFVVGEDEPQWLWVNNAAFSGHAEQGGWTLDTLDLREGEEWFSPAGFRLHERDGRVVAFCWTKVHDPGTDRAVGEIYVIAVHPQYHGLGLGRQLTLAGLDHLTGLGLRTAMLYVDASNAAAVGLYESLGFELAMTRVAFVAEIASDTR